MRLPDFIVKTIGTFFYVGYLPLIPGTFGSIAGLAVFYLVKNCIFGYSSAIIILAVSGFLVCGKAEEVFNKKDPRYVVIDEVVGMLLALIFLPYDIRLVLIGFFLFRLFDTLKPFPAGWLERRHGSIGIMSDDIAAGLYTNIVLQVVFRLASFKAV